MKSRDEIKRFFFDKINKKYSPFLVSVVHLAYSVVFWGLSGVCRSLL